MGSGVGEVNGRAADQIHRSSAELDVVGREPERARLARAAEAGRVQGKVGHEPVSVLRIFEIP